MINDQTVESSTSTNATIGNTNLGPKLENLVLRLLIAQYKATGFQKGANALSAIRDRIKSLGGTPPLTCVARKRITACQELVQAVIAIVPFLGLVNRRDGKVDPKVDARFIMPIACAIVDAFKVAASDVMLGAELDALHRTVALNAVVEADDGRSPEQIAQDVKAAKMRVLKSMMLPVDTYIDLLDTIPGLVYEKNHMGFVWIEGTNRNGTPLRNLEDDIKKIGRLVHHLRDPFRTDMQLSVEIGLNAIELRRMEVDAERNARAQVQQTRVPVNA